MTSAETGVAASVVARLLTQAKATGEDHQGLLTAYAFERARRSQRSQARSSATCSRHSCCQCSMTCDAGR